MRPGKRDGPRQPDGQPNGDELDGFLPCRVSVPPAVLPPKSAGEIGAKRDVDLVALSPVSEVDARVEHGVPGIVVFLAQRLEGTQSEGSNRFCNRGRRPIQRPNDCPAIFQLYRRDQDAVRGEGPRKDGDQHARNSELSCERPCMHRTGPAEGQERKVPRVESTPSQDDSHRLRHGRAHDPLHSEDRFLRGKVQLAAEAGDSLRGEVRTERQATSEETRANRARSSRSPRSYRPCRTSADFGGRSSVRGRRRRRLPRRVRSGPCRRVGARWPDARRRLRRTSSRRRRRERPAPDPADSERRAVSRKRQGPWSTIARTRGTRRGLRGLSRPKDRTAPSRVAARARDGGRRREARSQRTPPRSIGLFGRPPPGRAWSGTGGPGLAHPPAHGARSTVLSGWAEAGG